MRIEELKKKKYIDIINLIIICIAIISNSFIFISDIDFNQKKNEKNIYNFVDNSKDTISPQIIISQSEEEFYLDHALFTIRSREKLNIENLENYFFETNVQNQYYYEVLVRLTNVGENNSTLEIMDKNNNLISESLNPKKVEKFDQTIPLSYIESEGEFKVIENPTNKYTLLSNNSRLPADYYPSDLIDLNDVGIKNFFGGQLRKEAAEKYLLMQDEVEKDGIEMFVTSAFRSFQQQGYTYNYIRAVEGESAVINRAEKPGFSEHQLGLAVDVVNDETRFKLPSVGQTTRLYNWLESNAYKYGFIKSYDGSDDLIREEQWHWRYVGTEISTIMFNEGLTLKQYVEKYILE